MNLWGKLAITFSIVSQGGPVYPHSLGRSLSVGYRRGIKRRRRRMRRRNRRGEKKRDGFIGNINTLDISTCSLDYLQSVSRGISYCNMNDLPFRSIPTQQKPSQ